MRTTVVTTCLALAALFGCSSTEGGPTATGPSGRPGKITVVATDTECRLASTELPAGTATFAVSNNGTKVTEFYVYAAGDRVMGEVENITPGLTREVVIELPSGMYQAACKPGMTGTGIRTPLKVTGAHRPLASDSKLAAAVASYRRYIKSQSATLLVKTKEFADAVKAGDIATAKKLYPEARTYWERIEPVAETFGELDPAVDARENDVASGQEWTGFHRIEKDLWVKKDVSGDGPIVDRLLADVTTIATRSATVELSPAQLAGGAKELLDEVATGKITGEEDRYSHTDLWDFDANLQGSRAAMEALRPVLREWAPDLAKTIDDRFASAEEELRRHRSGDGWKLHTELSRDDLRALSDAVNALAEPISRVAAVVAR